MAGSMIIYVIYIYYIAWIVNVCASNNNNSGCGGQGEYAACNVIKFSLGCCVSGWACWRILFLFSSHDGTFVAPLLLVLFLVLLVLTPVGNHPCLPA
jgi:hypothetical protein